MSEPEVIPKTKIGAYTKIINLKILFETLSSESQKIFLESLNKNPFRYIIQNPLSITQISNFDNWRNYFLYQVPSKEKKVVFVCKSDIPKVQKNIRTVTENDWILNSHKVN